MSEPETGIDLARAPVTRALLSLSAPVALGMVSTFLFQVVDTFFVGRLGPGPLAALSYAGSAFFLLVGFFMGISVGVSAVVANAVGRNDLPGARRATTLALALGLLTSVLLGAAGVATLRSFFGALGAGPELLQLIGQYMTVLYVGFPLLTFSVIGSAAIRAIGRVGAPESAFAAAGLINAALDYILIFGVGPFPELGFRGAAIATVLSWVFLATAMTAFLVRSHLLVRPVPAKVREDIAQIVQLSTPAVATQLLLPATGLFLVFLASRHGAEVVAAMGVATRVEGLLLVGISGVTVAIVPFAATNFGAGLRARIDAAVVFAGKASTYWGAAAFVSLLLLAGPVARLFSDEPEIVRLTRLYLHVVGMSYGAHGLVMVTAALFNGIQMPGESLRVLVVKTLGITVPAALVGSRFGALGIFVAISVSNLLGAAYAGWLMRRRLSRADFSVGRRSAIEDYKTDARRVLGFARRDVPGAQLTLEGDET